MCFHHLFLPLKMCFPGLGPGIFSILSGLRALSRHSDYRLRVVRISDMFSHVPCMNLVHAFLSAVPLLQTLLVSFDLKTATERGRPEESWDLSPFEEEIPGNALTSSGQTFHHSLSFPAYVRSFNFSFMHCSGCLVTSNLQRFLRRLLPSQRAAKHFIFVLSAQSMQCMQTAPDCFGTTAEIEHLGLLEEVSDVSDAA